MRIRLKKYKNHLLVFLLIIASGNPLFVLSTHVRELYIGLALLLTFVLKRRKEGFKMFAYIKYTIPFIFISVFQLLLISDYSMSSAIYLLLKLYIGALIMMEVGVKFAKIYVDIMMVVALVSIPLFFYNEYIGIIPGFSFSEIGTSIVIYTQLFSDYGGFISRNAGMFWEPGSYQGYLNFAILFYLLMSDGSVRIFKNWRFLILVIALITTKSTTGYAVFAFIIIFYLHYYYRGKPVVKYLFVLAIVFVFWYAYQSLDFLGDKIQAHADLDKEDGGRFNDFIKYGDYIRNYFFFGNPAIVGKTISTGNGFLAFLFYYGIGGLVYYFIALWKNIRRQVDIHTTLFFVGVTLISLQGEGFIFYPCYLAWPFMQLSMTGKMLLKE